MKSDVFIILFAVLAEADVILNSYLEVVWYTHIQNLKQTVNLFVR